MRETLGHLTNSNNEEVLPLARRLVTLWESPIPAGLLALSVYSLISLAYASPFLPSRYPYFNYLADAFLHGQLNLRLISANTLDLSLFNQQLFLYWPPLPAIILIPFVALFGVHFSDVAFTLFVGALNVSLIAVLIRQLHRRQILQLSKERRGVLVLFFALGTVHVALAPFGRVWFTSQLIAFCCVTLAYLACISLRGYAAFFFTGVALASAFLTRNHLLLAGLWPAFFLFRGHRGVPPNKLIAYSSTGLAPIVFAVAVTGLYNWLRFGNVLDNGITHHMMHSNFISDYQRYGYFSVHYLPTNFFYQYISYPFPYRSTTPYGGSLFLLSPVFIAAFWCLKKGRLWSNWILLITVLLVSIPIDLLMGTGWMQFGPRYTLDFTVPLLILTAVGSKEWSFTALYRLTLLSVVQYLLGDFIIIKTHYF